MKSSPFNRTILAIALMLLPVLGVRADDAPVIRKQFIEYLTAESDSESAAKRNLKNIRPNGSWSDIDYASQRRGGWPTRGHLTRLEDMTVVYADPDAKLFQSLELRSAIVSGLNHWIEKDYRNPNWWNGRIGVPKSLAASMILLGDDLPEDVLKGARPILLRSKMGMTGQNKVWCAGNNLMVGLLYDEPERMEKAVTEIWSELRVSTEEGIQPDWSFHQHGPQQQFGNYGLSFAGDMLKWAAILRGTDYELSGDKLEVLRNYLLEGVSWIIWHRRMDLSGCGRQIDKGAQKQKGQAVMDQLLRLIQIYPSSALDCYSRHDFSDQLNGFKPFWRSEMAVQRRPEWYASVKMSSKRVIGSETCNSENMQGLHLGDGTLLVYQDGSEYEDIVPLWDWKRLPGTTCDQGFNALKPSTLEGYGGSGFSGVLGDGETGIAAMIYKRNKLSARKSYFFFKDHIVCLGAGISGETKGPVYTSVQQSWRMGEVNQLKNVVRHGGMSYLVMDGMQNVEFGEVTGNWNSCFPSRADRPVSGDIFSIWIDHGKNPENASYAYKVFPIIGNDGSTFESKVLTNGSDVQAVTWNNGLYAVFYEAGEFQLGEKWLVEASGPCLLYMSNKNLVVSDPTHTLQALEIKVNGKVVKVNLPQGDEKGKQVMVK